MQTKQAKKGFGTLLPEVLVSKIRQRANLERRTISQVTSDALCRGLGIDLIKFQPSICDKEIEPESPPAA